MHTKPLTIVDCREPECLPRVLREAETRRNFILILNQPQDLQPICDSLGCDKKPEKLERWGIHAFADVLQPTDYSMLLNLYEAWDIRLIEQLRLKCNAPPKIRPFILYCEVRGIISDHETLEEAASALLDYLDSFKRARLFPLAGIYRFTEEARWERVRRLTG